jgi:hypothetical protein
MFQRFASLTRFSHDWAITEKLDGTNACVLIAPIDDPEINHGLATARIGDTFVFCQSRNNVITPDKDNAGFARFVKDNAEALVGILGEGRHFGEWVGKGVQKRHYDLTGKVFALFNTNRWLDINELNGQLRCAPLLAEGYMGEPGNEFANIMAALKEHGSLFAPGYMDPEGIVMRHGPSGTLFKKTFDYDEQGKWAENQARREGN